jgi:outer membrane lipoprotein-sorting protein
MAGTLGGGLVGSGANGNRAQNMQIVEIDLEPGQLCEQMAAMRMWLDDRRWEPSTFSCHDNGAGVLLRIEFKVAQEGEAFARRFGGRASHLLVSA